MPLPESTGPSRTETVLFARLEARGYTATILEAKMRVPMLAAAAGLAWFAVPGTTSTMTTSARPAAVDSFPTYDSTVLLESTSETSANVSAGDVNGDGYLDLVLAKGRHWPLVDRVLLGDGKGGFRP